MPDARPTVIVAPVALEIETAPILVGVRAGPFWLWCNWDIGWFKGYWDGAAYFYASHLPVHPEQPRYWFPQALIPEPRP